MSRTKGAKGKHNKEKVHKEKKKRGRPSKQHQKQHQQQIVNVNVGGGGGGGGGPISRHKERRGGFGTSSWLVTVLSQICQIIGQARQLEK